MNQNAPFNCYVIYVSTIAHFSNSKYDVTKGLLNKKNFVDPWNNIRFNSDGILFKILSEKYKPSELIKMFAIYFYNELNKVHPSQIINDNFQLWENTKIQFNNPVEFYKHDLYKLQEYCVKNKLKLKQVLHSNDVFKIKLKMSSIIILNDIFLIGKHIRADNELEAKLVKKRKLYVDKLHCLLFSQLPKHDWKQITKESL